MEKILESGNYVSKEQPSTIDDPTIKNGYYDAPTVVCVFCQDNFLFKTADAFCRNCKRACERGWKTAAEQTKKTGEFWVARSDSKVVGTIGLMLKEKNCAVMKKFFVKKEFRSKKVGLALYKKFLEFAKEKR